jgi:hypothetical protein
LHQAKRTFNVVYGTRRGEWVAPKEVQGEEAAAAGSAFFPWPLLIALKEDKKLFPKEKEKKRWLLTMWSAVNWLSLQAERMLIGAPLNVACQLQKHEKNTTMTC